MATLPYTQSTIWLFRRGREWVEQKIQPLLFVVLFLLALPLEQGEMGASRAVPWGCHQQGTSPRVPLLLVTELAVQMSPAGAQSSQMEQPALGSPCAKGLLSAGLGRAVLKAADGSELRAHVFYLCFQRELAAIS